MWGYFAFSHLLGMEMEDPSPHCSSPCDPRACTSLQFGCRGPQEQAPEDCAEHTAERELQGVPGRIQQGVVGSSSHQVVSGISPSSCDVNGFEHLGQAHTIPHGDCAFHLERFWLGKQTDFCSNT